MARRKIKKKLPFPSGIIAKLAPKIGAKILIEPEWKVAGQIIYPNGKISSFFFSFDINSHASTKIAHDKHFAKFFIRHAGYPVAPGQTFFEAQWARSMKSKRTLSAALSYAKRMGYPVIVKPNDKTEGENVSLVHDSQELRTALVKIWKASRVALIERYMPGKDYRIVVFRDKVIAVYERTPLSLLGDGKKTIRLLWQAKQKELEAKARNITVDMDDERIRAKLRRAGYTSKSILPKGFRLYLLDNANLSAGGDGRDVTALASPGFRRIAVDVTKKMGLELSGVDIMITEGDITEKPDNSNYYVIEINAAPGLYHYSTLGKRQQKTVEALYLQILKSLGKKS